MQRSAAVRGGKRRASSIRGALGAVAAAGVLACAAQCVPAQTAAREETAMSMTLTSSAFADNGTIPAKYTCEGQDLSPPLAWSGVPANARSLVLIVDDPDAPDPAAPKMTWVHWVLYDIPAGASELPEGVTALPAGTREGLNDWQRTGYGGPCPPVGRHRYFHKLYALDVALPDLGRPTKAKLEAAMKGHVVAQAQLIGTYQKRH
jgi:Raf kinase inhibitor-like YbhB/YbcL family protein